MTQHQVFPFVVKINLNHILTLVSQNQFHMFPKIPYSKLIHNSKWESNWMHQNLLRRILDYYLFGLIYITNWANTHRFELMLRRYKAHFFVQLILLVGYHRFDWSVQVPDNTFSIKLSSIAQNASMTPIQIWIGIIYSIEPLLRYQMKMILPSTIKTK